MSRLAGIVPFAHALIAEVLRPGDFAVDLTAGNGHDTLFLRQQVTGDGTVVAFDLQEQALHNTARRLQVAGIPWTRHDTAPTAWGAGVHLVGAGHERLTEFVRQPVRAVIANLGYLPGSDRDVVTLPPTTISALDQSAALLPPGGRMAVVVYTGHPGGRPEAEAVETWFSALDPEDFMTLRLSSTNRPGAPFLLAAGKTGAGR